MSGSVARQVYPSVGCGFKSHPGADRPLPDHAAFQSGSHLVPVAKATELPVRSGIPGS